MLPIRKIAPDSVALTSYYGKTFVNKSRKRTNDYGYWLVSQITLLALNTEDKTITNLFNSDVFTSNHKTPRAYSAIARQIKGFTCKGFDLNFDYNLRESYYGADVLKQYEKQGIILFGRNNDNQYLAMDQNNTVYIAKDGTLEVVSTIEHFLNIDSTNAPVEFSEVGVLGKDVPVGVVLAYYLGFEKLLKLLSVTPRRVPAHTRLNTMPHEWSMVFSDETLVFNKDDRLASLVLAGFTSYHRALKQFSIHSFEKKGVYLNLLEANGISVRYIREIDLMAKMFIDPITRDILLEMKEPTNMQGLLLRSCELLLTDEHPHALDPKYMRIKGYERISGAVYTELVQSIRQHDGKLAKSNVQVELNPFAVWKRISEDTSKSQVNEINPIESLKETEAVTYSGNGGRSRRSMTKTTRSYHPNDMGTISESTVDSSDVSINIYTSADPQFKSLRGMSRPYDLNKKDHTALLSTSALLAPGSDRDD